MGKNLFRLALKDPGVAFGARCITFSPMVIELYGRLGFDFVWLDAEHGGRSVYDIPYLEGLARAAELGQIEILYRVPANNESMINSVLDAGIKNILIPGVETPEDVAQAIRCAKYFYNGRAGRRGLGTVRANFWGESGFEWAKAEDEEVIVGVMIEHIRAVECLEEILDVPELGFVYLGPSDLSVSLGQPKRVSHPAVVEAITRVEEVARARGVPLGKGVTTVKAAQEALEKGYRILRLGGELSAIRQHLGQVLKEVKAGIQSHQTKANPATK